MLALGQAPGYPPGSGESNSLHLSTSHITRRSTGTNTTRSVHQEIVSTSTQTLFAMDQKSLLEVLTSVAKVSESEPDTYTNEGYVSTLSRVNLAGCH